jgi:hypothetical protein
VQVSLSGDPQQLSSLNNMDSPLQVRAELAGAGGARCRACIGVWPKDSLDQSECSNARGSLYMRLGHNENIAHRRFAIATTTAGSRVVILQLPASRRGVNGGMSA